MISAGRSWAALPLLLLPSCAANAPRRLQASTGAGALAVDRAGNVYVAGGSIAVWDATGQRREFRGDVRAVTALVADEQYLYCADVSGIRRFRLNDGASVPFNGGTAAIPTEPGAVRAMDVAGSTLYVADARTGTVRMFDTESGRPTGDFPTPLPTAVAIDAIGQTWVPTTAAASARIAPTAIRA